MNNTFKQNLKKSGFSSILGQLEAKQALKSALLMSRNIILVGPPGVGKTTLAKSVADTLGTIEVNDCQYHCSPENPVCPECLERKKNNERIPTKKICPDRLFVRVQGSPDLTAEDLIGDIDPVKAIKFGPLSVEAFTPGKIFKANNGILFFDEINRCSEKLQNALLQVLQEGKVTIGSYDFDFDINFVFIGTMNPDDISTEPLSDVFLDRFDLIYMTYPESLEIEEEIVHSKGQKMIDFPDVLLKGVINFVRVLRQDQNIDKKPSVRATLGLFERSQSTAFLKDKKSVELEDVMDVVVSVLSHRISLKPSVKYLKTPEEYIKEKFEQFVEDFDKHCP